MTPKRNQEAVQDAYGIEDDGTLYIGAGLHINYLNLREIGCPTDVITLLKDLAQQMLGDKRELKEIKLQVKYRMKKKVGF